MTRDTSPPDPYPHGQLITVPIPAGPSGFRARPAYVYLPPAALRDRSLRLPVLELLHGTPGNPSNWQVGGNVTGTLDAFAAQHRGRAPIVVMPDVNGTPTADSECVRVPAGGDIEQYLTVQVPRFVTAHYPASTDHRQWAIAGLSSGATCSLLLSLRAYPEYRAFGDFSGLAEPSLGKTDNEQAAIVQLFGGSHIAFDEHNPLWLMGRNKYPGLYGWLSAGATERAVTSRDNARVSAAARPAGIHAQVVSVPGGHNWVTWTRALQQFLPWMWPVVGGTG